MQLLQHRIDGGGPAKRLGVGVVVRDELVDPLDELLDAGERAPTNGLVGDQGEEALDLVGYSLAMNYRIQRGPRIG